VIGFSEASVWPVLVPSSRLKLPRMGAQVGQLPFDTAQRRDLPPVGRPDWRIILSCRHGRCTKLARYSGGSGDQRPRGRRRKAGLRRIRPRWHRLRTRRDGGRHVPKAGTDGGTQANLPNDNRSIQILLYWNQVGVDMQRSIRHVNPLPITLVSGCLKEQSITASRHRESHGRSTDFDVINVDPGADWFGGYSDKPHARRQCPADSMRICRSYWRQCHENGSQHQSCDNDNSL